MWRGRRRCSDISGTVVVSGGKCSSQMNSSHLLLPFASSHLWQLSCSMVKHISLCALGERVHFLRLAVRGASELEEEGEHANGAERGGARGSRTVCSWGAQDNNLA